MSSFCKCKSYSHFFSKRISIYAIFNNQSFNDMLTNNMVSFEQLSQNFCHHLFFSGRQILQTELFLLTLSVPNLRRHFSDEKRRLLFVVCFDFLTNYVLEMILYVKLKDWIQMTRLIMSHLIWIFAVCKSLLSSPVAVKRLKVYSFFLSILDTLGRFFHPFWQGR